MSLKTLNGQLALCCYRFTRERLSSFLFKSPNSFAFKREQYKDLFSLKSKTVWRLQNDRLSLVNRLENSHLRFITQFFQRLESGERLAKPKVCKKFVVRILMVYMYKFTHVCSTLCSNTLSMLDVHLTVDCFVSIYV